MPVPGAFEIVGLIASILELAGLIRHLFTRISGMATKSWVIKSGCLRFLEFLDDVEDLVKSFRNPLWEEISAMKNIMKKLKLALETARNLVSGLLDANGRWIRGSASKIAMQLGESQASIQSLLDRIQTAAISEPSVLLRIAQDGNAHRGDEDLNYHFALSVHWEELLTANRTGSSYQVQESLGIGSTSHSNPQNTMSSDQVRANEEYARDLQERWGSSQVEDDEELEDDEDEDLYRAILASLDIESLPN